MQIMFLIFMMTFDDDALPKDLFESENELVPHCIHSKCDTFVNKLKNITT